MTETTATAGPGGRLRLTVPLGPGNTTLMQSRAESPPRELFTYRSSGFAAAPEPDAQHKLPGCTRRFR